MKIKKSRLDPLQDVPKPREKTDLPHHLPYQLVHVSALLSLGVSRLFQTKFNLGIREWRVLAILGHYGPSSAADLVGRAAFDKATVSRAIKRLETEGMVGRCPHPTDARRQLIYLTEKGVELHDRIAPLSIMRKRIVESALTEKERESLQIILEKLRGQLEWLNQEEGGDMNNTDR
ncbi:transcriptional regulator [Iodidimonas muriae]|uniref:Transcriptional regulator n=1 Tax=Iodidimonas muriae TaxID=261467 RepID=A0ABQ2LDA9_9PROT|nr:MarR family winged helix-turn-helix transcriptional regulator [Iodidimonas muriae]GER07914.1 transcriptional regulator [Kordiimonadales bacterium JCM 17843]GGO11891.1 transcriptional regulator [Iodidimonas muriae]